MRQVPQSGKVGLEVAVAISICLWIIILKAFGVI
jgi:hypothetical protein